MSKQTEVAVIPQTETAVSTEVKANRGFENVSVEAVTMPIAKILQPISKEVADEAYTDYNFKAGNIIHSLLLEKLQKGSYP